MNFDFTGSRGGRTELFEEAVFVNLLKESNATQTPGIEQGNYFEEIIKADPNLGEATQRDAYAVGSIIQWLGTRVGVTFLDMVRIASRGATEVPSDVFVMCWQNENVRSRSINGGYTALELVLSSHPLPVLYPGHTSGDPSLIDPISERDELVILATMRWLGTEEGQNFLAEAERRIEYLSNMSHGLFQRLNNQPAVVG